MPLVVSCYDVTLLFVGRVAYYILRHPMWDKELWAWISDRLQQWGTETDEEGVLVGKRHEPDFSHMIRSVLHQPASTHISAKSSYGLELNRRGLDWPALEIDLSAALKRYLPIRLASFLRQHPKPCKVDRNSARQDNCNKKNLMIINVWKDSFLMVPTSCDQVFLATRLEVPIKCIFGSQLKC